MKLMGFNCGGLNRCGSRLGSCFILVLSLSTFLALHALADAGRVDAAIRIMDEAAPKVDLPDIEITPLTVQIDSGKALSNQSPGIISDPDAILLVRHQFVPAAESKVQVLWRGGHVIIQYDEDRVDEVVTELLRRGVEIVATVPRHAFMATVPSETLIDDISGIRWSGTLKSAEKISDKIHTSLEKDYLLVDMHSDVSESDAEAVIREAGGKVLSNPYLLNGTYLVNGDANVVRALSEADPVAWIWPASDAIIAGERVHACPDQIGEWGPLPKYVINSDGWDGPGQGSALLTYHFVNETTDAPPGTAKADVVRAMNEWARYASINWVETATAGAYRSVDIGWFAGDHGDGYPFDGLGTGFSNVLAHTLLLPPTAPEPLAGDIHFDEADYWGAIFEELYNTALHESGHALGLGHSADPSSVMYTYFDSSYEADLTQDDIDGIRSIYAATADGYFVIRNLGTAPLEVSSVAPRYTIPWLTVDALTPFTIGPGESRKVFVMIDWEQAPLGEADRRILVESNDPDESPYPNGVYVAINNSEEFLTIPSTPAPSPHPDNSICVGDSWLYTTTGATSNLGHTVEYSFDWGDGTFSAWSESRSASHTYTENAGSPIYPFYTPYIVVWARCKNHPHVNRKSDELYSFLSGRSLRVEWPNGGKWVLGEKRKIRWTGESYSYCGSVTNGEVVFVELRRNGNFIASLFECTPNDGRQSFTMRNQIPIEPVPHPLMVTIQPGRGYVIRISSAGCNVDESEPFRIVIPN